MSRCWSLRPEADAVGSIVPTANILNAALSAGGGTAAAHADSKKTLRAFARKQGPHTDAQIAIGAMKNRGQRAYPRRSGAHRNLSLVYTVRIYIYWDAGTFAQARALSWGLEGSHSCLAQMTFPRRAVSGLMHAAAKWGCHWKRIARESTERGRASRATWPPVRAEAGGPNPGCVHWAARWAGALGGNAEKCIHSCLQRSLGKPAVS